MSHTNSINEFAARHNGVNSSEIAKMLKTIGVNSLDQLIDETVPAGIRRKGELNIPEAQTEFEYLAALKKVAAKNKVYNTYIGQGYHGTITPSVILRGVFQNPGWYTQYTPYQAEIAQGRLEGLLNFQTMVSDLTGLPIANASLLDEATAAAEAMAMFFGVKNKRAKTLADSATDFLVSDKVLKHTIDVLRTRAEPIGIKVKVQPVSDFKFNDNTFGILLQYPANDGLVEDYRALTTEANSKKIYVTAAADIMSLVLLTPPGEWGVDAVVGSTQRFGVPVGFGGPHAAYFSTKEDFKRLIPGRIIGVSEDAHGDRALRMALQTREQHIRREKATSNICTAQALLANIAGFYAVYHGAEGIKNIATKIHHGAKFVSDRLRAMGLNQSNEYYFDTLRVEADAKMRRAIRTAALRQKMNFFYDSKGVQISIDETTTHESLHAIVAVFEKASGKVSGLNGQVTKGLAIPKALQRTTEYLAHPVFNSHHTESKMMRYLKRLENKDISLVHSMIPLGSCTMKLNAASEMFPVSWEEFANIHPFAPANQWKGYAQIFEELEAYLSEITGFAASSLQPNSGAQGEHAGLMTIRAYHKARKEGHRNISLIPSSAHGTNPASAVMAGMKVVVVKCDDQGNIDIADLKEKAEKHKENLSSLMVTYPSTHGVYEEGIKEVCKIIHDNGGLVYMDGANMNAQVGLTSPGHIDADVCHLNLHKTFAIPHGGGGPGMGPICVNEKLAPFLPKHSFQKTGGKKGIKAVSAAPWGSASILLISYGYIRMLGKMGLLDATKIAILNANYIKARLTGNYEVLFTGKNDRCAHEMIIDLRPFKELVSAEDVAKRLIDFGFHAPTLSFPVAGTLMIEPTESEDKDELDRFCDAMLEIRKEIDEIAAGDFPKDNNVLHNAPHTMAVLTRDDWDLPYSREKAAYPLPYLRENGRKMWATVGRVNNAFGDRNLICTCPPIEAYEEVEGKELII